MIGLASGAILLPFLAAFAGMLLGPWLSRLLGARPLPAVASPHEPETEPLPLVTPEAEAEVPRGERPEITPVAGGGPRAAAYGRHVAGDLAARAFRTNGPALLACVPMAASTVLALIVALTAWRDPGTRSGTLTTIPTGSVEIGIGLEVDGLAALVGLMVCCVALAVQVYSVAYMAKDPRYSSYAAFISLFTAAMLLVVYSGDLLLLYVGWEVMGVCSYFLIGHHWESRDNSRAAVKAFLVTRIGDVGFLFGIFALGLGAGTFSIEGVLQKIPELPNGTVVAATLLLLAGVAGKSAQFPLHTWLPDAMAGPTPISALIHAATMVAAGIYVVARLYPAFLAAPVSLAVLGIMAAISMLGAALAALAQDDLKRVLAYSTVSQLAYMAAGLAVGAKNAAVFHLITHGAFKALLFLAAGCVIFVAGSNMLQHYGGLRTAMPITFWSMTIGFAALVGLPPVSGFFSKDAVIEGAQHAATNSGALAAMGEGGWFSYAPIDGRTEVTPQGYTTLNGQFTEASGSIPSGVAWLIYLTLLATVAVTAAYAARAWLMTFFGEPRTTFHPREAPKLMSWPVAILAVPAAILGFFGLGADELRPHLGSAALSLLCAAAGLGAVYAVWNRDPALDPARRLGRLRPVFDRAFYVDEAYEVLIVRPVRALAQVVVTIDDKGIDAAVEGTAGIARRLGGQLRRPQNGNAQAYLTGVLAGVVVIAAGVVIFL